MLSSEKRLTKVRDFTLLMKNGRWFKGNFLDICYLYLKNVPKEILPKRIEQQDFLNQLKVAFTVGLKVDKRAVMRNRIRRQMREVVRLLFKKEKIKNGIYILLVARKGVLDKNYKEIEREIESLLGRTGILK
jgi:ribonuclease P protein component